MPYDATMLESMISGFIHDLRDAEKAAFDSTLSKWSSTILWVLANEGPKTATELAQRLRLSKATVHTQVQSLLSGGYILQGRGPYGSVPLSLNPEHEGCIRGNIHSVLGLLERIFAVLDEIEAEALATLITKLRSEIMRLRAERPEPSSKDLREKTSASQALKVLS
jgi:DNA-binding MarR family transcriptional regulator